MPLGVVLTVVLLLCCGGFPSVVQAQTGDQNSALSGQTDSASNGRSNLNMRVQRIGLIDLDGVLRASKGTARVRELLDEQRQLFQAEFAARETALQESSAD